MIGNVPIWTGRIGVIRCMMGCNCDVGVDVFGIMLAGAYAKCILLIFSNVLTKIEGAIGVTIEDEVAVQQIEGSMREVVKCELIVLLLVMSVP
jgi:hypothetical protein